MPTIAAVILGVLIGWLIEWVIDWLYWRKPREAPTRSTPIPLTVSATEMEALKRENAYLKSRLDQFSHTPDDLKVIKGIGPEIERRLNAAGILTFAQLSQLTPADLEVILGDVIKRLANEQDLLDQARDLANAKK